MASITVDLGAGVYVSNRIIWFQSSDLGPIFDANDEDQELSQVAIYTTGFVTVSITGGNNRFTPEFEATGRFIFEASDGEMLEITIGNADMSEQYGWTPTNSVEVIAFANHVRGLTDKTATLTLTDEAGDPPDHTAPSWTDDTGDAQAWTQNEAITPVTVPGASGIPVPTYAAVGNPAGIAFNPDTRVISGTPTTVGTGTITVTATNSEGSDDWTVSYTTAAEIITPPPPPPPPIIPVTPRAPVPSWTISATMFGNSVDLTHYVAEATWKHGSRPPNHFGHMADPAVGALTLLNHGGEFKTFKPDPFVDTSPGSPVRVTYNGMRLFTGKTGLTLNQVLPGGRDIAVMPMLGPLAFLGKFSEGIFARLNGVQLTSEVFALILQDAGYEGPTDIEAGRTELSSLRLNRSNLLGSGRMRTAVLGALRTIVQAEVGRGYDNRLGRVVFENRTHRSDYWATGPSILRLDHTNSQIERASIESVDDAIVNIISGTGDGYNSLGVQDIDFEDTSFPISYAIPTGGRTILLDVDISGNTKFVQSWEELLSPVDYTYTLDLLPIIERGSTTIGIFILNPSPGHQTFVLKQVRGEPFAISFKERLFARRQASIDAYGPRPVIYPSGLLTELAEIRDHLEWAVALHDGIDQQGRKDLNEVRALSVTVNLLDPANAPVIGVDLGTLVEVTEPRLGLLAAPFWVDSAEYTVVAQPDTFRVKMDLSDARASMMWALGRMRFGYNTRVGF